MSYTNLLPYSVDGYQRISYNHNHNHNHNYKQVSGTGGVECGSEYGRAGESDSRNRGDGSSRAENIVISKELMLGCKPEKADDFRPCIFEPTWCVYIRALDNVDMGRYVRRVTFRMSPRLPLRLQVADASPFEITEVLSTDFPIELQVEYLEPGMSSTTYVYKPNDVFDGLYNVDARMNFKGHERRDKMYFVNPNAEMKLSLSTPAPPPLAPAKRQLKLRLPQPQPQAQLNKKLKSARLAFDIWQTPQPKSSAPTGPQPSSAADASESQSVDKPAPPRPIFNVRV
ncbi:CG2652 [Drosophila busckii]|uniref:CG2652 n=1 Tax=Drosophila busckii TaxID=30019 RepID=A0A0M5JE10_DROBS|nr:uncharacterized protein LOC108605678 [Drosophila busckii]ALC49918.1 CG2652 [Drosophila busckii]